MVAKFGAIQEQLEQAAGRKAAPAPAAANAPDEARVRRSKAKAKPAKPESDVHIGAYLPADFKRSLMLVRAETGEDVKTLIARALNELFRAHKVPVVDLE
jgi:hypothetical protein